MALLGGALADRSDRRLLLLLDQIGLVAVAAALCAVTVAGYPSIAVLFVLAGLLAGFGALRRTSCARRSFPTSSRARTCPPRSR